MAPTITRRFDRKDKTTQSLMSLEARFSKLSAAVARQSNRKPANPRPVRRTQAPARVSTPRAPKLPLYAQVLADPLAGPLVGVPTTVPVQTHVVRVKAIGTYTTTTGAAVFACNPIYMTSSNGGGKVTDATATTANVIAAPVFATSSAYAHPGSVAGSASASLYYANAPYSSAEFIANAAGASSVRARVVSCVLRVCNVSAVQTRNGTFVAYQDPGHNTIQGMTADVASLQPKVGAMDASSSAWASINYTPADPDEVEGWIADPAVGVAGGIKAASYVAGNSADGGATDSLPGYLGVWWTGTAGSSQTFRVECHAVVEYIGTKVQALVRPNPAQDETAHAVHALLEKVSSYMSPAGAPGSGHPVLGYPAVGGGHAPPGLYRLPGAETVKSAYDEFMGVASSDKGKAIQKEAMKYFIEAMM